MSREKQLLGFKPLHPACRYFCQLCGEEVSADQAVSRVGRRDIMDQEESHLFCKECAPSIDRICNTLASEEIRLKQQYEAELDEKLRKIAEQELELLSSERLHGGEGESVPPPDTKERRTARSPRRRASRGMIPNPNARS